MASPLLTGLVSYWKLDEASGTRADSHGSNDLTDNNTVTQAVGKIENAAQFTNANSESLSAVDGAWASIEGDMVLAGWVYMDNTTGTQDLVAKLSAAAGNFSYDVLYSNTPDRLVFRVSANGTALVSVDADTLGSPSSGTWYFIVAYHDDGTEIGISVNGGAFDTTAHLTGIFDGNSAFRMGAYDGGAYFDGRLDEWGLWNALPASLTTFRDSLYNSGSGLAYPFSKLSATLATTGAMTGDITSVKYPTFSSPITQTRFASGQIED